MKFPLHFVHRTLPGLIVLIIGLGVASVSRAEDEEEFQNFTARAQATWVWQKHPGFSALYSGPNSLSNNQEIGYTLSGTIFMGYRPIKGTEFFFDPEVTQGYPFSGLHGLGGITNGEAQKGGTPDAVAYWSRAFLRQTFGFGGGAVEQESSFNQFAGSVDRRRFVFTGGVYALTDIFDQNAYAHDPRTQFLNWANMDYGAWDFPADARGYTRGITMELYWDDWAFRAGRNMLPIESNGLMLDQNLLNHYSDNVEIEHAHELFDQPGKLRLLGYRNQAVMGNYNNAMAAAALAGGGVPDLTTVRNDQVKLGFGVSLEQALSDDVGVFARYSWNNGQAETYAFAEIDNSLSIGLSIKGNQWSRPNDTIGLAFATNGLSRAHVDYLAAGGSTTWAGDGALNYQRESIYEMYYSIKVNKILWATLDYQRINNPAYNADRGAVNVYSVRMHMEF